MPHIFESRDVTKRFAAQTALNKVSIAVPEGSIFGLLGPNGAGKTTLIRIINRITAPDEGEILLKGKPLTQEHTATIGYLPEERGLYKKMKVGEQALYLAQLKGINKQDALKRLKYWFEKFEIQSWWNRKVEELSKGMQQKLQFIITIIHEPELLIFDEPFSGFDPININLIKDEILSLRNQGASIIFSTHNMASVEELCDHIALINKAEKILEGRVRDIKSTYRSNTYHVEYIDGHFDLAAVLPAGMQISNQAVDERICHAEVRLSGSLCPNDLLQAILPHAEVHGLREIVPTMNDIFISRVKESLSESSIQLN